MPDYLKVKPYASFGGTFVKKLKKNLNLRQHDNNFLICTLYLSIRLF